VQVIPTSTGNALLAGVGRRRKYGLISAAAAGFVTIGLVFGAMLGQRETTSAASGAGGPVVSSSIVQVPPATPVVSVDSLPPSPSAVEPEPSAEPSRADQRDRRRRAPVARGPAARAAVSVSPRSESAAPSAAAAPTPAASAKRAWDPSAFGGRY
jgi:hypothetical protein